MGWGGGGGGGGFFFAFPDLPRIRMVYNLFLPSIHFHMNKFFFSYPALSQVGGGCSMWFRMHWSKDKLSELNTHARGWKICKHWMKTHGFKWQCSVMH